MTDKGKPATPRWVKWGAAALAALLLAAVVFALSGQGHGPRRHFGHDMTAPSGEGAP